MKSLSLLLSLSLIPFLLLGCGGAEERKAAYMEKAQQSIDEGDLDKARIELKNVLQIDPKHAEGFYMLGEVFEKQQEFRKAFGNYNKAAELNPDNAKYQSKLGQFYLVLANDIETAEEKAQAILEKDPDNIHGQLLKAGILLRQDKMDDAIELSKSIAAREPGNVQNAIFLATLHNTNKNFQDAVAVLEKALSLNQNNTVLMDALANVYYNNQQPDKAEALYLKKLEIKPGQYNNYIALARFYSLTEQPAKAESVLRDAIEADPEDPQRMLTLIQRIHREEGNAAAVETTKELIRQYPQVGNLRIALAQLYSEAEDLDSVKQTFQRAIKDFPEDETGITARVSMANAYLAQNEIDKAREFVDEALEVAPNDANVNMVNARIALLDKKADEAVISLRKVVKDAPENLNAYFLLAAAHMNLDEMEQADDVLARAYENNRDNEDNLLKLAKYHMANQDREQTERIIDDVLALNKSNAEALAIKANILNAKKNYEEAKELAGTLIELLPEEPNGYILFARAAAGLNDAAAAESMLMEGYEKTGNNMSILEMLTNLQSAMKKHDAAIQRLDDKLEEEPSSILLAMKGKALLASGKLEEGEASLLKAKAYEDAPPQIYLLLSRLYASQGEKEKLMALLEEGVERYPSNVEVSVSLASLYERDGDVDAAIELYEGLVDAGTGSNNAVVINNLAALLSDYRSDAESLQRALELVTPLKEVDQPMLQDTVGWVYYRNEQFDKAIEVLNRAVAKAPENPVFNYHLGMALYDSGDHEAAKKHLEIAANSEQDFSGKAQAREVLDKI